MEAILLISQGGRKKRLAFYVARVIISIVSNVAGVTEANLRSKTMNNTLNFTFHLPRNLHPRMLNINEASKACNLSPSVLRIWELRYGWPNPKRKANGYRTYSPHLVEDLKRVAKLVQAGFPIRQLIVDGLPQWPPEDELTTGKPRALTRVKELAKPTSRSDAGLQNDIFAALETRRAGLLRELIQRCQWQVRPQEEPLTYLAPLLCGITELERLERPLDEGEASDFHRIIQQRCEQLRQRCPADGRVVSIIPCTDQDHALACLVALVLTQRGLQAQPRLDGSRGRNSIIMVSNEAEHLPSEGRVAGRILLLDDADPAISLPTLLDPSAKLPSWAM